jgi:hypothetical protein
VRDEEEVMSNSSKNTTSWTSRHSVLTRVLEVAVSTFVWWASDRYLPVAFRKLGELFTGDGGGRDDSKDDGHPASPVNDTVHGGN